MVELRAFGKSWWCHGGGAAVLMLLVVTLTFRSPAHSMFWFALAFFAAHTALTVRRYRQHRVLRTQVIVTATHTTPPRPARPMWFVPSPIAALMAPPVDSKNIP